jgi:hypothetical protein
VTPHASLPRRTRHWRRALAIALAVAVGFAVIISLRSSRDHDVSQPYKVSKPDSCLSGSLRCVRGHRIDGSGTGAGRPLTA